ncbi:MAG TPA: polysaccharide lyase family 7 protein [Candidatus Aquilonibacter sp.]|nr:polysaccharide lyase family 7 protein [Candidatus Aquilonibacter sp.]
MHKLVSSAFLALLVGTLTPAAFGDTNSAAFLTSGWTPDKLDFKIQVPYDQSESNRYSFTDGVYHLWVFNLDKPFAAGNTTLPRSEMRFMPDYASGQHQFEADMMVPVGTDNVTIMQIHTGNADSRKYGPVALMLQVHHGGSLYQGNRTLVFPDIYGKWFHLNVVHDVAARTIKVYINNKLAGTFRDPGAPDYYFKCGVYTCRGGSREMQDFIKNVKLWNKP